MGSIIRLFDLPDRGAKQERPLSDLAKISAQDAINYATKVLRSVDRARSVLEAHLLAGRLFAFTNTQVSDVDFGPVPMRPRTKVVMPVTNITKLDSGRWLPIFPGFWQSRPSFYGHKLWHWDRGCFATIYPLQPGAIVDPDTQELLIKLPKRKVIYNVHFVEAQIIAAVEINTSAGVRRRQQRSRSDVPKPRSRLRQLIWERILQDMYEHAGQGRLGECVDGFGAHRGGRQRLVEAIADRVATWHFENPEDEPSYAAISRQATRLVAQNREASSASA